MKGGVELARKLLELCINIDFCLNWQKCNKVYGMLRHSKPFLMVLTEEGICNRHKLYIS